MSRVQSIERAVAVLSALSDGPIGVTDVAERATLPKSTAARLLSSLAHEGFVEQVPGGTHYRLGPRILTLAASIRPTRSLVALARPQLAVLADAAGEAAGLSIPDGFLVHYVDQVDSTHPVGVRDWTGTRLPMHAVSSGLVMLAHLAPVELERFLRAPRERFTPRTVIAEDAVRARVRQALLEGHAWTAEEYAEGITSVAAPVADEDGEVVAAVHVHGPTYRFPGARPPAAIAGLVMEAGRRISANVRETPRAPRPTGPGA
jgi:DNA-binding IclR family transcriptional regulator